MGRKRKASGQPFGQKEQHWSKENEGSKLAVNSYEDVADSEDEFHIGRDKVFLDENPTRKRIRRAEEQEALLEPSDEEVLPSSDLEPESDVENHVEEEDEDQTTQSPLRNGKPSKGLSKPLQESSSEASGDEPKDDDFADWGSSKKEYYNADTIETEADALEEEAEALRLQQKQRQRMTEADFGLDEIDWEEDDTQRDGKRGRVVREELPELEVTSNMSEEQRMAILRTRYPEFEPLAKEFVDLQEPYKQLQEKASAAEKIAGISKTSETEDTEQAMSVAAIKFRSLGAYLSAIAVYFALLSSTAKDESKKATAIPPDQLQNHSLMHTLVQCRDLWEKTKELPEPEPPTDLTNGDPPGEHDNIMNQRDSIVEPKDTQKKRRRRKSRAQRTAEAQQAEAEARRQARIEETQTSLADLSALLAPTKANSNAKKPSSAPIKNGYNSDSDIGEPTSLTPAEAAEKAKRKKTLRFYTSQIAQKSQKRDHASNDAGGDADLPYRERFRDRKERLNAEAENRGRKSKDKISVDDFSGEENPNEDGISPAGNNGARKGDDDDYYDFITANSKKKKAEKAARAEAVKAIANGAALDRVVEDANLGPDGKRAVSYAIEKNKGLTPKRKKDVRNPRVKKKNQFEKKMKKLSSVRPVYKGQPQGGYGGELTGIKIGVSKGVRL
ncbi:uncharacterized protein KY384_002282 [Bacidia gigantensis]|uniref:uncharacterized protein n=1 Tax=Bacidia gigantensis TaxID=2732470 RepID=UPI001D046DE6|nr:uncharacterized protein KY384_002282 [Bacidia gigantensis]KAG8533497.1 hypothetical protein KY384_002282 [Bacidia gigantensis]